MSGFNDLDEAKAADFIGKTILIGVTYEDHNGNVTERHQWFGTITSYSNEEGINVRLTDSDEFCCLPPSADAIHKADPGEYRLRSTGKVVENPDYLTTWTCREPEPGWKRE